MLRCSFFTLFKNILTNYATYYLFAQFNDKPISFRAKSDHKYFLHTGIFVVRCSTTFGRKYSLDSFFLNFCSVNSTVWRLTGANLTQLASHLSLDSYCSSQKLFHMVKRFSLVSFLQCFLQNCSQGFESINRCFRLSRVTYSSSLLLFFVQDGTQGKGPSV